MLKSRTLLATASLCLTCGATLAQQPVALGASAPMAVPASATSAAPPAMQVVNKVNTPMSQPGSRADQLSQLNAEIPLLEAQAKIAKLKEQIAHPSGGSQGPQSAAPGFGIGSAPSPLGVAAQGIGVPAQSIQASAGKAGARTSQPQVLAITGYNGKLQAIVRMGAEQHIVNRGATVDGWLVADVMPSAVVFSRSGKSVTIRP